MASSELRCCFLRFPCVVLYFFRREKALVDGNKSLIMKSDGEGRHRMREPFACFMLFKMTQGTQGRDAFFRWLGVFLQQWCISGKKQF